MQPEPSDPSNHVSTTTTTSRTPSPVSQYGFPVDEGQLPRDVSTDARDGGAQPSPATGSLAASRDAFETRSLRMRSTDACSIEKLPNEVLTHALSHCSPTDLSSVTLVSRRFHHLVTTQHAWRAGFARFFPGADSVKASKEASSTDTYTEKRSFTRLSALASWRSEYMIRTRLLRSLARGKPIRTLTGPPSLRTGQSHTANATVMYNSQLLTTVNHLHANFGAELNKRAPRLVHGADDVGSASSSDPMTGKVDSWGLADPQMFLQFTDVFPGEAQYGLGSADVVGVPNVMDVSQAFGMVHGEGSPGGTIYYRALEEQRGRRLQQMVPLSDRELGIPQVNTSRESVCSVWIAKSPAISTLSDGLVGILSGSSAGILSCYSLGSDGLRNARMAKGELTARWVISPGVPIVAIAVDEAYSMSRRGQNRVWAVALNALGEVFYLTQLPRRPSGARAKTPSPQELERLAWTTGRSCHWNIVEPSRRSARPNPYGDSDTDGSYSPRSSWDGMCLTKEQVIAEIIEIETFVALKPKKIQERCLGWDMRRKLVVDFAGDDGSLAGESVVVFECGLDEDSSASVTRFTRCRFEDEPELMLESVATIRAPDVSMFGGESDAFERREGHRAPSAAPDDETPPSPTQRRIEEEWRVTRFASGAMRATQITTTAIDNSNFATISCEEDPLLGAVAASGTSSPWASPSLSECRTHTPSDIPGQRARLVGVGTGNGVVILWDVRQSIPRSAEVINVVDPCRIIYTDSPSVTCLALTALYAVHGGNDGLVQAWDILASSSAPIRTLNSRFSSRARRRLLQAQASPEGIGINLFAAGAIALDPDPTSLRGVFSLGTHLKYWGFSSTAADQYRSHKRRLRRSERSSNNSGPPGAGLGRGNIKDFIANERFELAQEQAVRNRERDRLAGRFGTDMLQEDEAIAYAAMLSQESLVRDEARRRESAASSAAATPFAGKGPSTASAVTSRTSSPPTSHLAFEDEIAEAIRRSLGEQDTHSPVASPRPLASTASYSTPPPNAYTYDIPIRQARPRRTPSQSPQQGPQFGGGPKSGSSKAQELSDLDYALQLSLAEEQSREELSGAGSSEDYPVLEGVPGAKGKGRAA